MEISIDFLWFLIFYNQIFYRFLFLPSFQFSLLLFYSFLYWETCSVHSLNKNNNNTKHTAVKHKQKQPKSTSVRLRRSAETNQVT